MGEKVNTDIFIKRSKNKFGEFFDYSLTKYINKRTKLIITCPIHGDFEVLPYNHLKSDGCPKCVKEQYIKKNDSFIKDAIKVHGNKYDYSKVDYKGNKKKIIITCSIHGDFEQIPIGHLRGNGCPKCKSEKISKSLQMSTEEFIKRSLEIHGNNFNYEKTDLNNRDDKKRVIITCNECGKDFKRTIGSHLSGNKCPFCYGTHLKTNEEFIEDAKKVHGNKYDYSKVDYKGNKVNVIITCYKHGDFLQTPNSHLKGKGCPRCKNSFLENNISLFLQEKQIDFEYQKRFEWLGKQSLDFYLPQYNVAIECQGGQHYKSVEVFGGEEGFKRRVELDELKKKLCTEHNLKIFYYSNNKYDNEIITNKNKLLKEILNYNDN